jgi:hypothetical protein
LNFDIDIDVDEATHCERAALAGVMCVFRISLNYGVFLASFSFKSILTIFLKDLRANDATAIASS